MTAFMMKIIFMSSGDVGDVKVQEKANDFSAVKAKEVSLVKVSLVKASAALEAFAACDEVGLTSVLAGADSLPVRVSARVRVAKASMAVMVQKVNLVVARAKARVCLDVKVKVRAKVKERAISVVLRITGRTSVRLTRVRVNLPRSGPHSTPLLCSVPGGQVPLSF